MTDDAIRSNSVRCFNIAAVGCADAVLPGQGDGGGVRRHIVSFRLDEINLLSVSGDAGVLVIDTATTDEEPLSDSDNSTTYAYTTNGFENAKKITASLNPNMPAFYTLTVALAAPTGATSLGVVPLNRGLEPLSTASMVAAPVG